MARHDTIDIMTALKAVDLSKDRLHSETRGKHYTAHHTTHTAIASFPNPGQLPLPHAEPNHKKSRTIGPFPPS